MNDIWPLIVGKLDNSTFAVISMTPLWFDIVPAIRSKTFWFSRIEWLLVNNQDVLTLATRPLAYGDFEPSSAELWKLSRSEIQMDVSWRCKYYCVSDSSLSTLSVSSLRYINQGR